MSDQPQDSTENVDEIMVDVWDFSQSDLGVMSPGFYYSLPTETEGEAPYLDGPHPTSQAALDAARAFIKDAINGVSEAA